MCLRTSDDADPSVVFQELRHGVPAEVQAGAASLGDFVLGCGFRTFVELRRPYEARCRLFQPSRERVERLEMLLRERSFRRHAASEGYTAYFEREDVVADMFYPPGARYLQLMLYGDDEVTVADIAGRISREPGTVTDWLQQTEPEEDEDIPEQEQDRA
jgi:hypothetical protein